MRKLLSYIWPNTQKVDSKYNGVLELTYINGKKVLDSKNANYSYGSLQKILKKGISEVDLNKIQTVLLLGLGGGCVLKEFKEYTIKITAVELDEAVIEIAKKEFLIEENNTLEIVNADALQFMRNNTHKYDLVITDLFIDNKVPLQFYEDKFCDYLYNSVASTGSLIFNLGMSDEVHHASVKQFFEEKQCKIKVFDKVQKTNTLLVVNK